MPSRNTSAFDARLREFRALAEPTRLRLIRLLSKAELTVSELTEVTAGSQPGVSRHLRVLCDAGLVARHAEGSWVFYRATIPDALHGTIASLGGAPGHADDDRLAALKADRAALAARYFAQQADAWDAAEALHGGERDLEAAVRDSAAALAASSGGRLDRVIDLGTGSGRMLLVLDGLYDEAVGYDANPAMLRAARSALLDAEVTRARIRLADIHDIEDPVGADLVVLHHVLHVLPDPAASIGVAAKLAASGHVLIADLAPHEEEALRESHMHRRLGFSDETIEAWAADAGLKLTEVRTIPARVPQGLTAKLWRLSRAGQASVRAEEAAHVL